MCIVDIKNTINENRSICCRAGQHKYVAEACLEEKETERLEELSLSNGPSCTV